jgi:hypothetical protein
VIATPIAATINAMTRGISGRAPVFGWRGTLGSLVADSNPYRPQG